MELSGFFLLVLGVLLHFTIGSWDKELSERRYLIQEEVNLAILSSLNDIASIQSSNDKEFKEDVAKSITDVTNKAYTSSMMEKERRSVELDDGQISMFRVIEVLLLIVGGIFIVRGRWIGFQGIKQRAKAAD